MPEKTDIGTVTSTFEGPSPSNLDFVVNLPEGIVHRGQYVEMDYSEGTLVALVTDVVKTNRYFERAESVKEFESNGKSLFEQFPTAEWEYLIAKTKPLGVYTKKGVKRATYPPSPGTRVRSATPEILKKFLGLDEEKGLHLGEVEYHSLPINLNLSRLFQKHLAILAMSGAGKCVSPSTKIKLSDGNETEIGSLVDEKLSTGFKVEDDVEFCMNHDANLQVFSIDPKNRLTESRVKAFCRRKAPEEMFRVKTLTGKMLELTPEHMVPVLNEGIQWISANKLKENDCLFLPKPVICGSDQIIELNYASRTSNFHKKIKVDSDFARLFAYLLAEGHNNGKMFCFTNYSEAIMADFRQLCIKVFGIEPKKIKREHEVRVYNKGLALALQSIGFTNSSWTKFVPAELLKSKKPVIASFLTALIDCDGFISKISGLELCFASRKLLEAANSMLLRLGVVPIQKEKTVNGKKYARLFVDDAASLAILKAEFELVIDYKRKNLLECCKRKPNTNIDVIPNISKKIKLIMDLLNMSSSQTKSTGISNYLYRKDNPSFKSLKNLINSFEGRLSLLESKIRETRELFYSLPNLFEEDAQQVVADAYEQFNFKEISQGTGVSSTTARRMVRELTAPTKTAFILAKQAMLLQGRTDAGIDAVTELDFQVLAKKVMNLCNAMGFETQSLCVEASLHKNYLYQAADIGKHGRYFSLYELTKGLFTKALTLEKNLVSAMQEISFLKSLTTSNIFFDRIKKIESFTPNFDYVYDLSVENKNFIANHLIIHNSYLVSVLIEELLNRKKEDGRLATIIMDAHGEYNSFAEPVTDKTHKDFSSKAKVIKAKDIRIGVPKLSGGILGSVIPGLTSAQRRDIERILNSLRNGMKNSGPFDLRDVKNAITQDDEMKEQTKAVLNSWLTNLEELRLFARTDNPSINDLVVPGMLTIVDLSDIVNLRKKQIIVSYFAQKLFNERRQKRLPPYLMVVEEAHQFAPERTKEEAALSKRIIETIAREGRKFGASLCLISQRPIHLSTTALAQCNTHIILRVTNPYDLKHIGESSEGLDSRSLEMITSLRVGEALMVGEAVNYPVFFKVRERTSLPSKHEISLEEAALRFEAGREKEDKEAEEFL